MPVVLDVQQRIRLGGDEDICIRQHPGRPADQYSLAKVRAVGVWFSYGLLLVTNPKNMTGLLGVVLCVYAAVSLHRGRLIPRASVHTICTATL